MTQLIKCPNCSHEFELNSAIREELQKEFRTQMRDWQKNKEEEYFNKLNAEKIKFQKAFEENTRKQIASEYENQIFILKKEKAENEERLKNAREKELEFLKKMQELQNKEADLEIQIQKKLQEERTKITELIRQQELEKMALKENEHHLKLKEMEKQLEDQKKLIDEMQRKAEQGSMQLQGEVQELELEKILKENFPFDDITEIGKGARGADCIQVVRNKYGHVCGKIIYESKRTENFNNDWIDKLKADMVNQKCDIAVLVTKAMPKDVDRFGEKNGIYLCRFNEVLMIATLLRNAVIKVFETRKSQENKGDKMVALYDYLTGTEFTGNWNAIRSGFQNLKIMLQKERDDFEKNWKKKEKQLELIIQNSLRITGSIEGIAGTDTLNMELEDSGNPFINDSDE